MTDHDDVLDALRRRADRVHSHTPDAATPPPGIWQHVLASVQPQSEVKEQSEMISQAVLATPVDAFPRPIAARPISRYVNIAASLLVVAAIAFSGWFAATNLIPGGGDNNGIAFAPGTPATTGATCDVEPLTVDEVMQIVRNPFKYQFDRAGLDYAGTYLQGMDVDGELMSGPLLPSPEKFRTVNRTAVSSDDFEPAQETASQFIACANSGTNGQLWALLDPVWVHHSILWEFPVFVSEEEATAFVTRSIDQPAQISLSGIALGNSDSSEHSDWILVVNPDIDLAENALTSDGAFQPIVVMGVIVTDPDGSVILETNSRGYPLQLSAQAGSENPVIVVGKSLISGEWYVLPWLGY